MGNANSGPKPAPTALKLLRGVARKDRLNPHEPVPPAGEVVKPASLAADAAAVWDQLAPICLAMKTLTTADVTVFATLCELQVILQRAVAGHDARAVLATANVLRPYYALFGLEPVSRARIQVPKETEEPTSKWAGVLK